VGTVPAPGVRPEVLTDFGHSCDTIQGSSGSPVLDSNHRVVGLHHWGFDDYGPDAWKRTNRAVRMAEIRGAIQSFLPKEQ
jgi:V8-like Glu-specific endopeptidase